MKDAALLRRPGPTVVPPRDATRVLSRRGHFRKGPSPRCAGNGGCRRITDSDTTRRRGLGAVRGLASWNMGMGSLSDALDELLRRRAAADAVALRAAVEFRGGGLGQKSLDDQDADRLIVLRHLIQTAEACGPAGGCGAER